MDGGQRQITENVSAVNTNRIEGFFLCSYTLRFTTAIQIIKVSKIWSNNI